MFLRDYSEFNSEEIFKVVSIVEESRILSDYLEDFENSTVLE